MRFLLLLAFVCLISLNNCQEFNRNPIARFFGGLFGKKDQKENFEIDDPLVKEDFENQLPRQSTDKLINDAIEQRFLEESREQESIGSPFIQPADDDQDSSSISFSSGKSSRTGKNMDTNKIPIIEALRIVNSSTSLKDCVARVVCELSCNATQYGPEGKKVFSNLIKMQFDKNFEKTDSQYFRKAAIKGRQTSQSKQPCATCKSIYPTCKANSTDLVVVASMFQL